MRFLRSLPALAAVFLLWTCDKATPVAPTDATLQINANPVKIDVFGESTITVIGRKAEGGPVNEGTEINLSTTAGQLGSALLIANDRGVAETTLSGTGTVEMATVTASSGGAAPVTVDVQIGAVATSITLQATPTRVRRAGDKINLVATVKDDEANPIFNALVTFETDDGQLRSGGGAVATNLQGEAEDVLTVRQGDIDRLEFSIILVSASVPTTGGTLLFAEEEISVAGVPFEILLAVNPATVDEAGGVVALTALVADDRGKGVAGQSVIFSSDLGTLASGGRGVPTDARGEAIDTLTVTANDLGTLNPGDSFGVAARTTGQLEQATDTIQVTGPPVDPAGSPASLFLTVTPQSLAESGGSIGLSALVLDSDGLPVPDTGVVFGADLGTLASGGGLVQTDAGGTATDTLTATAADLGVFSGSTFQVTATAPAGASVTDSQTIDIIRSPTANFTTTPATPTTATVSFNFTGSGSDPLTFAWDFGDPGSGNLNFSSARNPTHTFVGGSGDYLVTLTVTNPAGSDTAQRTVKIP